MNRHYDGNSSSTPRRRGPLLVVLACILAAGWWLGGAGAVSQAPGVLVPYEPRQYALTATVPPMQREGFTIVAVATIELSARVLSREDYRFDTGAAVAPVDLTLGWGRMSDSAVLSRIRLTQGGRWWRWYSDRLPIPVEEINRSAANMHMIPATDEVQAVLDQVREGDIVELRGYLVDVSRRRDSWRWKTSRTRTDTGAGACELVWIESLRIR